MIRSVRSGSCNDRLCTFPASSECNHIYWLRVEFGQWLRIPGIGTESSTKLSAMGKAPFSSGSLRLTNKRDPLVYGLAVWYFRDCTHSIGSDTHGCSHARGVGTETPCPAQNPGVGTDTSLPGSPAAAVPLFLSLNVYGALHALAVLWKGSKISRSPKAQVTVVFYLRSYLR